MLAIGRKESQSVYLQHPDGTVMTVTVVRVQGDRVTLGVAAPRDVLVCRSRDRLRPPAADVPTQRAVAGTTGP